LLGLDLKEKIRLLPQLPGVYQYLDKNGNVIYVGKARKLKNRVQSYFSKQKHESGKTYMLVKNISDLRIIVTETEHEALLLENSLIKEYKPKYNIQLKDDKTYPWICIKKEPFPRIFSTRNKVKDGSEYYGPYASVVMMNTILSLIKELYPLRTCSLNLSDANIAKGQYKVCLEYHIGNCLGPCEGFQNEEDYLQYISAAREIIKGQFSGLSSRLSKEMKLASEQMDFEKAQLFKKRIEAIKKYRSKSTVVSSKLDDVMVFTLVSNEYAHYINFLNVIDGAVNQVFTLELKHSIEEKAEDVLLTGILHLKEKFDLELNRLFLNYTIDPEWLGAKVTVPQRGDKKAVLDLSEKNAKYFMLQKQKERANKIEKKSKTRVLETLKRDLKLTNLPVHIECFDNSNFQGTNAVAACVVFKNGVPSKKDYRHFNIKTVEGPDDFASMEEVVYRRYKRLLDENQSLPQLIVIDGGKGQLSSALKSLDRLGLRGKIAIIGIAKKLEEIFFPGDSIPIYIDKKSESLKLLQYLRNEAHRFGITHHRNKRSKGAINSELIEIEGIGEKTAEKLLNHYKSVKRIKDAEHTEICEIFGSKVANLVKKLDR
jgi:excinuclease ABC subunit C